VDHHLSGNALITHGFIDRLYLKLSQFIFGRSCELDTSKRAQKTSLFHL
jgi:hypothetical protein